MCDKSDPLPRLLTEAEAAEALRIAPRTLREIRARGGISFIRVSGRQIAYRERDLLDYIDRQYEPARELKATHRTSSRPQFRSKLPDGIVPFSQRHKRSP